MRVSVLIPTRNRLPYLRLSLESALAQADVDLEIVVSDDGSTDGTREYVAEIAAVDDRVRLLTDNPTPGIFENVEHLIERATGDVYTILGDDDLIDPDFCALLTRPMEADPSVTLTFTDHRRIDAEGRLLKGATEAASVQYGRASLSDGVVAQPEIVALHGGIWLGFTMFRASAFEDARFDRSCGTAADWDFAIRAATRGRLYYVAGRHGAYRDHLATASRQGMENEAELAVRVLSRHEFRDPEAESTRRAMLRAAAGRHAYQSATRDAVAARRSLRLHRSLGGSRAAPHALLAELLLRLPRPIARGVQRAVSGSRRAMRRRDGPVG